MNRIEPKARTSHDEDFALWSAEQAALLRAGRLDALDRDNLAEEIESLGRSERYQILHRLEVLLTHLLKWRFRPGGRSNSWKATMLEQRIRIADLVADSPSLKPYPGSMLARAYVIGLNQAITETGLPETAFPETCPWDIEAVLDQGFLPE